MHTDLSFLWRSVPMSGHRSLRSACLRGFAWLNTVVFGIGGVLLTPMQAWATQPNQQAPAKQTKGFVAHLPIKLSPPASAHCLKPLPDGTPVAPINKRNNPSLSLLDEVGRLAQSVSPAQAACWQQQLHHSHLPANTAAQLRIRWGEYQLAQDQNPEQARQQFEQAQKLLKRSNPLYGLAAYDSATSLFYAGAFQQAAAAFHHLLVARPGFSGFDHRTCALWAKHAGACAGYHQQHALLGIPEPARLDPLCGAASLSSYLQANGLPFDKKTVLSVCRTTGEGSSLQDVLNAAQKLGLAARAVTADDQGLIALPKPLTAFIERDHFISVVSARKNGISFICSDCGPYPGGRVDLSWKQWHSLDPGLYGVFCRKGSAIDGALSQLALQKVNTPASLQLASLHPQGLRQELSLLSLFKGHVMLLVGGTPATCGYSPSAQQCNFNSMCPIDSNGRPCANNMDAGIRGGGGDNQAVASSTQQKQKLEIASAADAHDVGAQAGDPVNLATLEEEYMPSPDLMVYNPIGPSVVFARLYDSLRGNDPLYEDDDLGFGWSTHYNVGIYDPGVQKNPQVRQGAAASFPSNGHDAPAGPLTWDVLDPGGNIVATSVQPNLWAVSYASGSFTLTPPSSAPLGDYYEVRYKLGASNYASAHFDVIPASNTNAQVPQGGSAVFASTFQEAPASGLTWDILTSGGTTLATSSAPNGWAVSFNGQGALLTVTAPFWATLAVNNKVRYHQGSAYNPAGHFDVSGSIYSVVPGTKYVFFPNGARVSFSAPSVPTASNPKVTCTVQAGVPLLVEWDYNANNSADYYTITFPDRTQWVTTTYAKVVNGTSLVYLLEQQIDRNANAIYFYYTTYGSSGFPLLSSITDSNNAALLTFNRSGDGKGNLTSVSDRYGRSIYYQVHTYNSSNVYPGFPQSQQEVDHVSQIVATGTSNPPDRYAYGYQNVHNGDAGTGGGGEAIPALHTITVPSPTGVGSSSATINYRTDGTGYVANLVDANGNTRSYTVADGTHTQVTVTDSHSNVVYSYTAGFNSDMSQTTRTDGAGTIIYSAMYSDPNDRYRPSQVQDGNGYAAGGVGHKGTWTYSWDSFGNCLTATTPRQTTTTYTISFSNFALGELTSAQTVGKQATTITYYEPSGLVHTIVSPLPGTVNGTQTVTTSATYDNLGNILTLVEPGNNAATSITTTLNYTTDGSYNQADAIGQPIKITDNLGKIVHLRYDSRANTVSMVDALGNETDTQYNLADQVTQITFPATGQTGSGHSYVLNAYLYNNGPPISMTAYNESGVQVRPVTATYGLEGELTGVAGSTEPVTVTYDGAYRVKTLSDGNSHVTSYYFTTAGYLGGVTYPGYSGPAWPNLSGADSVQFISFDNNGNPLTRVDGRGVTTNYVFNDVESRLTAIQYPASSSINVSLGYDAYGRLSTKSDGAGSYTGNYDDLNALTSVQTTYSGLAAKTISYSFYNDGSLQSMSTPAGNFSYSYDAVGRLSSLANPYSETTSWSWLDNDWLWKQIASNSSGSQVVDSINTYNALGEVTDLTNQNDTSHTVFSDFGSMGYDGVGNQASVTASLPATTTYGGLTSYQYDSKDELTQEQSARNSGYTNGFGYDSAGNPTSYLGVVQNFNGDNQNTASGYVWDGNGNPSTYKGTAFSLDAENRVTAIGSSWTAGYQAGGLRAWKQSGSTKTYYLYDGMLPVCELNSSGAVTAVNTFGANGLISRHSGSTSSFYAFDPQGNVSQGLNSNASIAYSCYFNAQGLRVSNGSSTDPYSGFGGQLGYYTDWETGLQLLGHRYYDAGTGRFLNRDPIGYIGGINLYSYVANNFGNSIDPLGYCPKGKTEEECEQDGDNVNGQDTIDTTVEQNQMSGSGTPGGGDSSSDSSTTDDSQNGPSNGASSDIPGSYIDRQNTQDMRDAPPGSKTNAAGFPRNGPWFWRQMKNNFPYLFNDENQKAIAKGDAPVVNDQWIKYNPTHAGCKGDKLIHHHIDMGPIASGLPERIHQKWHGRLHY